MFEFIVGAGCLVFCLILFVARSAHEHVQYIRMTAFK